MLVLVALLALSPEAPACSPDIGQVLDHTPDDGDMGVPTDAVIHLRTGGGYLDLRGEGTVTVTAEGEPLEASLDGWTWAEDLVEQTGFFTVRTTEQLPAHSAITVTVQVPGEGDLSFSFTTGSELAGDGPPETPSIELLHMEVFEDVVEETSCDTSAWRELNLALALGEEDPSISSWLVVYREPAVATDESGGSSPMAVFGPVGLSGGSIGLDAIINEWDIDGVAPEDECFTVVQVDRTGARSAFSDPSCASGLDLGADDEVNPACSTGAGAATLLPGLLVLLGLGRRRR